MKLSPTFLSLALIASLAFAPLASGGEVKKTPLKIEEAVQLLEEQNADFEEVKHTEAGAQGGTGLLGIALALAAGYYIAENLDEDDVKDTLGL